MFSPTEPDSQPEKPKNDNNLDDIFSSGSSTPPTPPPQSSGGIDDLFSPPPNPGSPYTPPPPPAQPPNRSRILYIILGVVIAFMCLCLGCIAVTVGLGAKVVNDPTFQAGLATGKAGIATVQGIYGTGVALASLPTVLPSDATSKGTLNANQQQSSVLGAVARDVWTYNGKSGESITITTQAQNSDLGLLFAVYDTNNKLLSQTSMFNSTDQNQTLTVKLTADGTYSILVGTFAGTGGASGNYTITVHSS